IFLVINVIYNKEYWKKELENVDKIYVVGIAKGTNPHWDRGIWRKFKLYYIKDGELKPIFIEGEDYPTYWIPLHKTKSGKWKGGYFECNALGLSRVDEIVYRLSLWLYGKDKFKAIFLN
ncbi:hypothetical protein J7L81_02295, partial [Candidatus Aerophobetes bacterium]|nr:hypothetical protein [Candidatus Aerophobetes bacterium]